MNTAGRFLLVLALVGSLTTAYAGGHIGGDSQKSQSMQKALENDKYDFISINSILLWLSNNGSMAHNPLSDASGLEWPQGSAKYAIFQDGLIWGGTMQGEIRVGGSTYRQGLQAGTIKPDGTASDPSDPRYRIYKIRKMDANAFAALSSTDQSRFRKDFDEWPVADGAPFVDKNNNGGYNPDFNDWLVNGDATTSDTPWFIGDEVLWFVSNDLDPSRSSNLYGTAPSGMEVHTMVWGYQQTGPLGNMVFTKYTMINKGVNDLENAYVAKWSDPDLGDANDDYVGIDTNLVLGYVYNGIAKDGIYGVPPAAGYDFFQGPIVPGDATDIAHYNFGLREGFKNLKVSSFAFYINSSSVYADPDLGTVQGAQEMYNYMTGVTWNGNPFIDPTSNQTTPICLAGDPITKEGWIDGLVSSPGDRRFLMTTGPFTLAKGDTQEVVVASIVGRGSDRLSSLQVLKYYDRFAQLAFDNAFDLPKAPPAPALKAALQPNKVILNWGDPVAVNRTEKFDDRGFKFEGYNIYQFPSRSSTLSEGKRLATYDVVNNVATIFDEVIDERSGAVVTLPVQFGTDAGLQHMLEVTNDAIIDRPLVNNQPYFFAVTAYSYNPDPEATPRQLESTPIIIEVRPRMTDPGVKLGAQYAETINVTHTSGVATGSVLVKVVDPEALTGDTYEVTFSSTGKVQVEYDVYGDGSEIEVLDLDSYAWNLTNLTKNQKLIDKSPNYNGLASDYYIVDGFQIGLSGSGYFTQYKPDFSHNEILRIDWVGGPEVYVGVSSGAYNWMPGYAFFGSSIRGYDLKKVVEVRLDRNKKSKGYMYMRGATPNYAYQGYFDSPVQIWDVTDPNNHKQLSYCFIEQRGVAAQDNQWGPTTNLGDREYLFIIDEPYSETPNPKWTGNYIILNQADEMPILYASWYIQNANYGAAYPWKDGDKWVIVPNVAFDATDKFQFTTAKPSYAAEKAVKDVDDINVFPNPYLGANAQELNKYQRFVTFNHLPEKADFRIYTTSGTLVRSFSKTGTGQLATWDLQNDNGLPVGSGMYIIHITMPELGVEKILKLGVVAEAQYLDRI
jgi:hypothetical protein